MYNVHRHLTHRTLNFMWTLFVTSVITACGGGNSEDGIKSYPTLTISGTAATGAPIANAPLIMKCAGIAANTVYTYFDTTDTNGAYSKRVDAASAPCIISVDYNDSDGTSQTMSSYVETLSSNTIANITPLTDAVLSAMMGTLTSTYIVASDNDVLNTLQTALQQNKDQVAWNILKGNLASRRLNTSVITGDPVSDTFSADPSHIGQGYDKLLDDIKLSGITSPQLYQFAGGVNRFETVSLTNDSEVHDKLTGLVWQRCVVGKTWNGTTCSGAPRRLYWSELQQVVASTTLALLRMQDLGDYQPTPNCSACMAVPRPRPTLLTKLGFLQRQRIGLGLQPQSLIPLIPILLQWLLTLTTTHLALIGEKPLTHL